VLAYNIPNVGPGLRLSADVIADIFLGRITTWNDPRIARGNPFVTLPSLPITVCHRFDGSGTTYIFTDYLSSVSIVWRTKVGKGRAVNWPTGVAGNGNGGVADAIQERAGAVGYVELAYALKRKMTYGTVGNRKGQYVMASAATTSAALDAVAEQMKRDFRVSLVSSTAENAYPICGVTYVLIPEQPNDGARSRALTDFLKWVVGPAGQAVAEPLAYAPLPKSVATLTLRTLGQVGTARSLGSKGAALQPAVPSRSVTSRSTVLSSSPASGNLTLP
jgi:phosphate transport system substrate-binding protein